MTGLPWWTSYFSSSSVFRDMRFIRPPTLCMRVCALTWCVCNFKKQQKTWVHFDF
jgi:hypothetical protein